MRRLLKIVLGLLLAVALAYAVDYAILRVRILRGSAFSQVTVNPYYALHLKTGKIEYDFQPPESDTCVNALFPHLGQTPCWYLRRHPDRRTDI